MASLPAFVLAGNLFHLSIVNFEIDFAVLPILSVLGAVWVLYSFAVVALLEWSLWETIAHILLTPLCFNVGLWLSIALYRLFFHRIRAFPGPWLAKLTRLYAFRLNNETLQMHLKIKELHEEYGDFVRVGPRELSINRASAIPALYGSSSKCTKSPWYSKSRSNPGETSLLNSRDPVEHKRRRRAWDRALGPQALSTYEPHVDTKVSSLISSLRAHATGSTVVDMAAWSSFFALDVMGEIGLGQDFQSVEAGTEHLVTKFVRRTMTQVTIYGAMPWFVRMSASLPGRVSEGYLALFKYARGQVLEKQRTLDMASKPQDILSWLVKARFENDKSAASEKALNEDSRLVIVAGSDTTSSALANAIYLLASNRTVLYELQQELDVVCPHGDSSWSYEAIKHIKILDFILHETLRLAPSVPGGLPRLTPSEGLDIDGVHIPGDVVVSAPIYSIQRDVRYWDNPEEFRPKRWEGLSQGAESSKDGYAPFTRGPYSCPGKQFAWMEMKMMLSRLVLNFEFDLISEEAAEHFVNNQKDTFSLAVPPLYMFLKERKVERVHV
ncbi:cytochrome P450 [Flagelloscypha sp. PMI_526]|nr:cytochrome P450 [Flagelloscypha sp. PMI_526]